MNNTPRLGAETGKRGIDQSSCFDENYPWRNALAMRSLCHVISDYASLVAVSGLKN